MKKLYITETSSVFMPMSGVKCFVCFKSVTTLQFRNCISMRIICNSIRIMHNITKFSITLCPLILKLPSSVCEFRKLETFIIDTCESLVCLPVDIGNLTNLSNFAIRNNNIISELPESISECKRIRILTVSGCGNMKTITNGIKNMQRLEYLSIVHCPQMHQLPRCVSECKRLKALDITSCVGFKNINVDFSHLLYLKTLIFDGCVGIKKLPDSIGCLRNLTELKCITPELQYLPEKTADMAALESLLLLCCYSLVKLPLNIGKIGTLRLLELVSCMRLDMIPSSIQNSNISTITLEDCPMVSNLSSVLSYMKNLSELHITKYEIEQIDGRIATNPKLFDVNIRWCDDLKLARNLYKYKTVKILRLQKNIIFELPDSTQFLEHLNSIFIVECKFFNHIPPSLSVLRQLELICISACSSFTTLPSVIGKIQSLRNIMVLYCVSFQHIHENICNLSNLNGLTIRKCGLLEKLPDSFGTLTALEYLCIEKSPNIEPLPISCVNLKKLKQLELPSIITQCYHFFTRFYYILPHLSNLKVIFFSGIEKHIHHALYVGYCLRASPCLNLQIIGLPVQPTAWCVKLGLPIQVCSNWTPRELNRFFLLQHQNINALAMGTHKRLGALSFLLNIDSNIFYMICEFVTGPASVTNTNKNTSPFPICTSVFLDMPPINQTDFSDCVDSDSSVQID
jgi:hypothetical protein